MWRVWCRRGVTHIGMKFEGETHKSQSEYCLFTRRGLFYFVAEF